MKVASKKDCLLNVTSKKQTFDNLHVNLPVVNHVLIAGGQPQNKGTRPDIIQQSVNKICERCFLYSCISLNFVQNVTMSQLLL